jgi:hypothetical protein
MIIKTGSFEPEAFAGCMATDRWRLDMKDCLTIRFIVMESKPMPKIRAPGKILLSRPETSIDSGIELRPSDLL